jgi:methyl-accepting chemotaxis protein
MNQPTPESPDRLITQILENALVVALTPILDRLDNLEKNAIEQRNSNQEIAQLKSQLNTQQESLNVMVNTLMNFSEGLNRLLDKLDKELTHLNQRIDSQERDLLLMSEALANTGQDIGKLAESLQDLSSMSKPSEKN